MANHAVKKTINLIDRAILGMTVQFESCICTLDSEAGRKSDGVKKHYPGKIKKDHKVYHLVQEMYHFIIWILNWPIC